MKSLLRKIVFSIFALFLAQQLLGGLRISGGWQTYFVGGFVFAILTFFLRPVLKIISLPLNLLTLGAFSFVINAFILYLLTKFVPDISIHAFTVPRIAIDHFIIPPIHLAAIFAFLFISVIISLLLTFLSWLTD